MICSTNRQICHQQVPVAMREKRQMNRVYDVGKTTRLRLELNCHAHCAAPKGSSFLRRTGKFSSEVRAEGGAEGGVYDEENYKS